MKQTSKLVKFVLPALAAGLLIASCASNDTNPPSTYGTGTGHETGTAPDTMMTDHTHTTIADTVSGITGSAATGPTDSLSIGKKDSANRSAVPKTGKKTKVSIAFPDKKANTAAMEVDQEGYYKNTEVLPAFPGGQKALERFFEDNIVYPENASDRGTEGTVRLSFAVDENGKVFNPVVAGNRVGDGIDEEAIRVFKKMPTWTPGSIKGKNVKTRYTLPVTFQLD